MRELSAENPVRVVDDQVGNPTLADDLAYAILKIIELNRTGIYHVSGADLVSRYEFALMLGKLKTLPEVRHQLTVQAGKWGVFEPADVASAVLMWWLDRVCRSCHGVKFQVIEWVTVRTEVEFCFKNVPLP